MSEEQKTKFTIIYSGLSDIGLVRSENQDSYGKFPADNLELYSGNGQLFIVADGVGGHAGGKQASQLAVQTISDYYFTGQSANVAVSLKESIEAANQKIYEKSKTTAGLGRMATTSTVLVLKDNSAFIGHVGDSKLYRIENNIIEQLTSEHTQVNEMLKEGILTEQEAKDYPGKTMLARALGTSDKIKVDIIENIILKDGQSFIICSDGLAKVNKEEILEIVSKNLPGDACKILTGLANERGGKDNVTVLIIKIKNAEAVNQLKVKNAEAARLPAPQTIKKNVNKNRLYSVLSVVIIAIIIFLFRNELISTYGALTGKHTDEVNANQVEPVPNKDENVGIETADQLFKKGSYEKALYYYQIILDKEPMHMGALDGVNKIMAILLKKADNLRMENNYSAALKIYSKIDEIKPGQEKIKDLILLCKKEIESGTNDSTSTTTANIQTGSVNEVKEKQVLFSGFSRKDWDFTNAANDDYSLDESGITFLKTPVEKKSIYYQNFNQVTISADIKLSSNADNSGAGIIVGYKQSGSGPENYFLIKYLGHNQYSLLKVSDNSVNQLLLFKYENISENLKIVCTEDLIEIYNEKYAINSWKDSKAISGKVGIYADNNVFTHFRNISIKGR